MDNLACDDSDYELINGDKIIMTRPNINQIVDQWSKRIEIYHSVDGKFEFGGSYKVSEDDESNSKDKIKVSIFEDLIVDVRDVFKWWIG